MSDMPDFDSMSPEEMMRWMESLAKRQGATEGLTTSADMEVAQVSADDDRLKGVGDYVPYGWTAEKWQEHLAKEEAAKASKQQAAPAPTPPAPVAAPVPAAQPVAQSAPETPDFDSMSPEEMMRWMESLAKRQGATEGLTTSADMDVAQVSADDDRLKDVGEYVPYGWTADKWQEHLAKEEAAKASKQQAAAAAPKPPAPAEEQEDDLAAALSGNVLQAPSFDDLFAGNNIIAEDEDDLEYADDEEVYQYVDEEEAIAYADEDEFIEYPDDSEPIAVQSPMDWLSGLTAQEPELSIDDDEEEDEPAAVRNPMDWLAGLGAEEPQLDFGADELDEEPEPVQAVANDPMGWLSGLTGQEAEIDLSLDIDALSSLESLGSVEASGDSMDWLAGLASETGDALAGLGNLAAEDEIEEGSLEWMESLARRQGAYTEELTTGGYRDIPEPAEIEDEGPGYEPFSFETGTGAVQADSEALAPMSSMDVDQLDMEDPGSWLDHLASGVSGTRPDESDMFGEEDLPELYEEDYEEITEDVMNRINTGRDVSPEEMQAFFEAQFRKAEQMPEEDGIEEDELAGPLEAQIPDWLRESMSTAPEAAVPTPSRTDTAEMMIENLGLDEEIEVPEELPEWLAGGMEADTGDIVEDIFASSEESEELVAIEEVMVGPLDTSDTWVQAFVQESTGEMEDWYKEKVAGLDDEPVAQSAEEPVAESIPVAVAAAVSTALEHIELPVETRLQAGEAQVLPAWMGGVTAKQETEVAVIEQHEITDEVVALDWLSGDDHEFAEEDGMPDWLRDTVDDSLAPREDLPDWLAGEDIGMIATDEIPDWLRETLDEEEDVVDASIFGVVEEPTPEPVQQAPKPVPVPVPAPAPVSVPVPVQKSPAPVPVRAASIDVAATLQAAQQKVSSGDIDGGLAEYEAVVRANTALDQVEQAVRKLADDKNQKGNPAVFRVLGDTLMRKGNLQEALDTYRKALNML